MKKLVLLMMVAAGCGGVSSDNIAKWKQTERGPAKLREALKDSSVAAPLRGEAFAAMVEIMMGTDAVADVQALPDAERRQVAHEAAMHLIPMMRVAGPPTKAQIEAKDALFRIRSFAPPEDADAPNGGIDGALLEFVTADLNARMSLGGEGSEKIIAALGKKAVPRLTALLKPGPSLVAAATLIGKAADPSERDQAVKTLVTQLGSHHPTEQVLQAIGLIGGSEATAYLVKTGEHAAAEDTRKLALFALAQSHALKGDGAALAGAFRIAGDGSAPGLVREAAFQLAEKIGPDAVPGLVKLMNDANDKVAFRAVEAALVAGGEQAVAPVLEGLNPKKHYKKEDLQDFVVADIGKIGKGAIPALQTELKSQNAVARTVAADALKALKP